MIKSILLLTLAAFPISYCAQSDAFFKQVTSSIDSEHSFYISLNVSSKTFTGKVIIRNGALFEYLRKSRGFDEKAYQSFMIKLWDSGSTMELLDASSDKDGRYLVGPSIQSNTFEVVESSQPFDAIYQQGCESFLQYYFVPPIVQSSDTQPQKCRVLIKSDGKDLYLKNDTTRQEAVNVVSKLFELGIPIRMDDLTGRLKIGYLSIK